MTNSIWSAPAKIKVKWLLVAAAFCACLALFPSWRHVSVTGGPVHAQNLQSPSACDVPVPNPLAVATLRWYGRNQAARFPLPGVFSMAFDGSNMYVLSGGGQFGMINKMRAADGATIATFSDFGTLELSGFGHMLFDGQDLFLQFTASDVTGVMKFRATDGALLGIFTLGGPGEPLGGMIFDGRDIWAAVLGAGVARFRATNLQPVGGFAGAPDGLAFDGHNVWVADLAGFVGVHRISDGSLIHSIPIPGQPSALAFDGTNMWVTNVANNTVIKIRVHDFAELGTFPTESTPNNIVFDGANIWVANASSNSITVLRACDGTHLGAFAAGGRPTALAFDGINVWVGVPNSVAKM